MPGFIYTAIIATVALLALWISALINTAPNSPRNILAFLATLFAALTSLLSLPIYAWKYKRASELVNLRLLYRRSLKWAAFTSLCITGLMALKAFNVLTAINAGLFAILYLAVFLQLKRSGR
ncbi:MAG: protein of unknown function with transmembrane region [candidate division WWE3 bacterium GW2011_GWC1_47_10]|uniref:Uncharacterized protein n=1 Tax=candidate division WWE3 bacterium GW2011_GWC1_47_10 TaxID=1619122 RepID=A0A0G1TYR4_UNCKA|nr:MAG: protein of unknown function with transmembrane region [candidate division WWE3 bacterium GW2011_GWC1_47_10]